MKIAGLGKASYGRDAVRSFYGLNRRDSRAVGESADEENVSSDNYPFIAPRRAAVRLTEDFGTCRALFVKDQPVWIRETPGGAASRLYYAGDLTPPILFPGEKTCVTMGTKIIVFPDKVWYDTANGDYGFLDAAFTSGEGIAVTYTPARLDGAEIDCIASPSAPPSPADGAYWCDTSKTPAALYRYAASSDEWVAVLSTYVKISSPGIGRSFRAGDGVTLSSSVIPELCASHVIEERGEDFILIPGVIPTVTVQTTPVTVARRAPEIDFAVEYQNRIWGCRYGLNAEGRLVNEIYASALGDPFNWTSYAGLVSDSYSAAVGSDGPFTGAAVFLGYVMFFKERCVHKVFGTKPSNFQIVTSNVRGVAPGASRSLAEIDGILYYASGDGVMAYDGAIPESVSDSLGKIEPDGAISSSKGSSLYVSLREGEGRALYVYNTKLAVWHRYTGDGITHLAGTSYGVLAAAGGSLYVIDSTDSGAKASDVTGYSSRCEISESWFFETGELTASDDDYYVARVEISCAVPAGGEMSFELLTDDGDVTPVVTVRPTVRRTFSVPVITPRHRRCRIRVSGFGRGVVYSITKFTERGN